MTGLHNDNGLELKESTSRSSSIEKILAAHRKPFDQLPPSREVWNGQAGSYEEGLGRLIILTPEIVQEAAASCIKLGRRVSLSWDMTKLEIANFNRQPAQHYIMPLLEGVAFDDVYIFNPQQSSQWDGLRHFGAADPTPENPSRRIFYGGVEPSEILNRSSTRIGIQHWAREGICGRGVLLDYARYAAKHGIEYSSFSDHAIPLSVLIKVAQEQKVTFKFGDILFIRIGLVKEWETEMTPSEKTAYATTTSPCHAGVEGTTETLRWIWDTGFAAVASDALSFEAYPPRNSYPREEGIPAAVGEFMHPVLLAKWGMPIGELFDLEGLSVVCEEAGRWEFFIASTPLNMPGGVSSPPNCLAIL
ncbi:hypothetical protein N7474_007413 [Penicillium riverlandense]|uniref:uncharacterized protein n=1 Tax=Penicillium riverlandense TaxID=1903569 RepID=UPI0025488B77|nr:uncharacterized protein N7474_007413 [Penicillium riverlandense]KAJ5815636.1 hypothetical protein N7474_007413 [Penicillium riverlandense]